MKKPAYRRKPFLKIRWSALETFLASVLLLHVLVIFKLGDLDFRLPPAIIRGLKVIGNVDIRDITGEDPKNPRPPKRPPPDKPENNGDAVRVPDGPKIKIDKGDQPFRLLEENKYEEAEKLITERLKKNPSDSHAVAAKGEIAWRQGRLQEADLMFRKAHDLDKTYDLPLDRLTAVSITLDRPDDALAYYEKVIQLEEPSDMQRVMRVETYLHRAADRKNKKDDRWKEDLESAKKSADEVKDQKSGMILVSRGKIAMLQGDKKKAIDYFEKSLESKQIENDYKIDILMALATLYAETGDRESAAKRIDQLVKLMDKWTPASYQRGLFVREYALIYKEALLGGDAESDTIFKHQRFYRKLFREKLQRPEVEVKQTLDILSEMVDLSFEEDTELLLDEINEYMSIAEGPKYPQCFFNKTVNRPVRYQIGYILRGDIHYRKLNREKAIRDYEKALEYSPGNLLILERIKRAKKLKQVLIKRKGAKDAKGNW